MDKAGSCKLTMLVLLRARAKVTMLALVGLVLVRNTRPGRKGAQSSDDCAPLRAGHV